jgi:hypothetical protein
MLRYVGLPEFGLVDEFGHGALTASQALQYQKSSRLAERFESPGDQIEDFWRQGDLSHSLWC